MKIKNLFTNLNYKIIAFILGYSLWTYQATDRKMTKWFTIPVCFYNAQDTKVQAPEHISIQLQASRSTFQEIQNEQLSFNIDCESLIMGKNVITNCESHIFLPTDIKVLQWSPSIINITKQKNE